jgi:hypothetical protein
MLVDTMTTDYGRLPVNEQVAAFQAVLLRNQTLAQVLARAAVWGLPGWYLVAGCLYQTAWRRGKQAGRYWCAYRRALAAEPAGRPPGMTQQRSRSVRRVVP